MLGFLPFYSSPQSCDPLLGQPATQAGSEALVGSVSFFFFQFFFFFFWGGGRAGEDLRQMVRGCL